MELLSGILSAAIAAIVSLIVALVSFLTTRHTLRSEREKFEKELQRSMTVRLYEERLAAYPAAIAITDGLRKSRLFAPEGVSEDYFAAILTRLDAWHSDKAFLLLSQRAVETLYELRRLLRDKPEQSDGYSKAQLEAIWRSKGKFRSALRSDIQLLYEEERR